MQELEIAKAKDKTLTGKLKRQKEAIDTLTIQRDELQYILYRKNIENNNSQSVSYMQLLTENKELIKKLMIANEDIKEKYEEIQIANEKIEEMNNRFEKTSGSLLGEIDRLNYEVEECKKCKDLENKEIKYIEDITFYRNRCDTLAAQLSRAEGLARRKK